MSHPPQPTIKLPAFVTKAHAVPGAAAGPVQPHAEPKPTIRLPAFCQHSPAAATPQTTPLSPGSQPQVAAVPPSSTPPLVQPPRHAAKRAAPGCAVTSHRATAHAAPAVAVDERPCADCAARVCAEPCRTAAGYRCCHTSHKVFVFVVCAVVAASSRTDDVVSVGSADTRTRASAAERVGVAVAAHHAAAAKPNPAAAAAATGTAATTLGLNAAHDRQHAAKHGAAERSGSQA